MAVERVFVDTNILVYANQSNSIFHERAQEFLDRVGMTTNSVCISQQVLLEYLAAVTRPQLDLPALTHVVACDRVHRFRALFSVLADGPEILTMLLDLTARHGVTGKKIHDANIVATMAVHNVRRLATFNPSDFRRFADIIDIEPL